MTLSIAAWSCARQSSAGLQHLTLARPASRPPSNVLPTSHLRRSPSIPSRDILRTLIHSPRAIIRVPERFRECLPAIGFPRSQPSPHLSTTCAQQHNVLPAVRRQPIWPSGSWLRRLEPLRRFRSRRLWSFKSLWRHGKLPCDIRLFPQRMFKRCAMAWRQFH